MKNTPAESARKAWNRDHTVLRRLLTQEPDSPKTRAHFLHHHAMVHSAKLARDTAYSFQDTILQGLSDAQMRHIPAGRAHSIAWLLWHMTRIEDATVSVLLANKPQVFSRWQKKLDSPLTDVGNEMSAQEIRALSEAIDLRALLAYRLAVGRNTRSIAARLDMRALQTKPDTARLQRLDADGTVRTQAHYLLDYWGGHPQTNLLLMPATRHSFVHFNEIGRMLPGLRRLT